MPPTQPQQGSMPEQGGMPPNGGMPQPPQAPLNIAKGQGPKAQPVPDTPGQRNWLDGPIPGESLTGELGSKPWEKPPRFPQIQDAMDYILSMASNKKKAKQILAFLEMGVPVEGLAKTIVISGFQQGLWTVSSGMMLLEPIAKMIYTIGKKAKIKNIKMTIRKQDPVDPIFRMLNDAKKRDDFNKQTEMIILNGEKPGVGDEATPGFFSRPDIMMGN